ncbi:MAG TPA: tetratricopeptide repeat protein [Gemmatimonadaceae bacterium]|nr:tetratricopeptide repeat protein [Gemmatimonadaceae bacterium]
MQDQIVERWETQNEAGRRFFGRGDFARAEQAFAAAIREAEQLGAADLRLATSLANLAQLKLRQKNYDEADRLFRRSLQIRESALGPDHASLVQTVNGLAAVCYARGDIDAAEPLFQRALAITERRLGAQHPDIVTSLNSLARIAFKRNDYGAAGPLLERLLVLKESTVGPDHPESAPILGSLVKVRCAEGALDEAERLARRVVGIREAEQPPSEMALASAHELLADVLARLGKRDDERTARQRATTLRGHPAATAGLMPLTTRHSTPETPEDVFAPHPTPSGLRAKVEPPRPAPAPLLGDSAFFLPESGPTEIITPVPASAPRAPVPSPISQMPRISMDGAGDEVVPRRKTPPAAPPPLPEAPRAAETNTSVVEGAGQEIVPIPAAPPPRPAPPVIAPPPPRPHVPRRSTPRQTRPAKPPPRRRRESRGPRPPRSRGGRKMLVALVLLISAGAAAATMSRGGVTESRGVADAPTREVRTPPRKKRAPRTVEPSVDSLAAAVRDSVALLIGQPPAPPPRSSTGSGSQEINVPAPLQRSDPLARQIQQMLPSTRQAEPETPLPPGASLNRAGAAAEQTAASAMARIDSATRRDVRPNFVARP